MNRRGALQLSAALGELLRDPVAKGRWVDLDRSRAGTINLPIEDVTESALALQGTGASFRR